MKTIQTAEIISQGGRTGSAEAADKSFSVKFGQTGQPGGATPEHLFAAAYAACFHSALLNAAERGHYKIVGTTVVARVSLTENDRGEWGLRVELRAALPGINRNDAQHLLNLAHSTCPYSKAVRGNVDVALLTD
jgi:lipoyl-dependent peroxiredoxin